MSERDVGRQITLYVVPKLKFMKVIFDQTLIPTQSCTALLVQCADE